VLISLFFMPVPDEGFINKPKHAACFGQNYCLKK